MENVNFESIYAHYALALKNAVVIIIFSLKNY